MVFNRLIDHLGNINPQLFRELKGRLQPRNVLIAIGGSLLTQAMLFLVFWSSLPNDTGLTNNIRSQYCVSAKIPEFNAYGCLRDSFDRLIIDWEHWWWNLCLVLSAVIVSGLILANLFLIVGDLSKEQRRGTIDFIRLSPQSARTFLIGKLIGVPSLVYLAVLSALPLHAISALKSGSLPNDLAIFYVVICASCCAFYSLAALFSLLFGKQPWLGFTLSGALTYIYVWILHGLFVYNIDSLNRYWRFRNDMYYHEIHDLSWWFLPTGNIPVLTQLLFSLGCAVVAYWAWIALERRYQNPKSTLLTKGQSYALNWSISFCLLGFGVSAWRRDEAVTWVRQNGLSYTQPVIFLIVNLLLVLALTILITPSRQALHDWARYRHLDRRYSRIQDLLWGEKSPATLATIVHVSLITFVWSIWILLLNHNFTGKANPNFDDSYLVYHGASKLQIFASLLLVAGLLLLYSTVIQWLLFLKHPKRGMFAAMSLLLMLGTPLLSLAFSIGWFDRLTWAWTFSVFGASIFLASKVSLLHLGLSFISQLAIATAAMFGFFHHLNRVGTSDVKQLMAKDTPIQD
ncbi:MAG: hypothetical protein J7642_18400 [Cyanobacteria bacterium SBC]|nr:hypothetical protein [Cyanobacteria bacterium SBC]